MERGSGRRTAGEVRRVRCLSSLLTVVCALALAGCNPDKQGLSAAQPRGATVAFDSLDGLPPGLFQKMVGDLNEEAQSRRLAVISREQPSAYRVRGYLAVKVGKRQTTVAWVWDVFDQSEQRVLRISGEEPQMTRCCAAAEPQVALAAPAESSPEAAGIFRVSRPDPIQPSGNDAADAKSEREAVMLAASAH